MTEQMSRDPKPLESRTGENQAGEEELPENPPTLALKTIVEEDFVSPLTALRGALEILRDFPDLSPKDRRRFVENALSGCARLEQGVEHLAASVYDAGRGPDLSFQPDTVAQSGAYQDRLTMSGNGYILEADFSHFVFSSTEIVDGFFDAIEHRIQAAGQRLFVLVNFTGCRIWPEAWVSYAHRGKKLVQSYARAVIRYAEDGTAPENPNGEFFASRGAALEQISVLLNRR